MPHAQNTISKILNDFVFVFNRQVNRYAIPVPMMAARSVTEDDLGRAVKLLNRCANEKSSLLLSVLYNNYERYRLPALLERSSTFYYRLISLLVYASTIILFISTMVTKI
jgi:hypothetical protein